LFLERSSLAPPFGQHAGCVGVVVAVEQQQSLDALGDVLFERRDSLA